MTLCGERVGGVAHVGAEPAAERVGARVLGSEERETRRNDAARERFGARAPRAGRQPRSHGAAAERGVEDVRISAAATRSQSRSSATSARVQPAGAAHLGEMRLAPVRTRARNASGVRSTIRPFTPETISSRAIPTSVVTGKQPLAIASSSGSGWLSACDAIAITSLRA